ncbi:DUF6188 family protein [Streptomyces vilmorinianum]|uniref:DUF6188 family protein n=1 Tax=Streptomyces vilmorinianum TaxID=3051092 RepID=UPI0010FB10FE|nr:DUF6188 family protein [Streptomyces vilmorinianum]
MEEVEDRWILGLQGTVVTAVSLDAERPGPAVTLADGTEIRVDGSWLLTQGGASAPGAPQLPARALENAVGSAVASAVAFRTGGLRVVLRTGLHLTVRPRATPGTEARVRKSGAFDWSSRDGACVMRLLGPGAR